MSHDGMDTLTSLLEYVITTEVRAIGPKSWGLLACGFLEIGTVSDILEKVETECSAVCLHPILKRGERAIGTD